MKEEMLSSKFVNKEKNSILITATEHHKWSPS